MKKLLKHLLDDIPRDVKTIDSYWIRGLFILPLTAFGIMHFVIPHHFEYMVPPYVGNPTFWVIFSGVM